MNDALGKGKRMAKKGRPKKTQSNDETVELLKVIAAGITQLLQQGPAQPQATKPNLIDLANKGIEFKNYKNKGRPIMEPVNMKGRKPILVVVEKEDPEYKAAISVLERDKVTRPKPKVEKRKCSDCGKSFDMNKAYPAGRVDNSAGNLLCSKCQNNRG